MFAGSKICIKFDLTKKKVKKFTLLFNRIHIFKELNKLFLQTVYTANIYIIFDLTSKKVKNFTLLLI